MQQQPERATSDTVDEKEAFDVPVVLIMFNRPKCARAVFDRIAAIRPERLFVIADGPRANRPDDVPKCKESRALLDQLDWPCDIRADVSDTNLGCRKRVSSGLDWVFDHVDRAIILEDDCVPDPSFFPFCAELLSRYQDEQRIRTISGANFLFGKTRTQRSYYFSGYHSIWGWATWRRSWRKVDIGMEQWPEVRDEGWLLDMVGGSRKRAKFWAGRFNKAYERKLDSWAYPYLLSCWLDGSLAVTPNCNLVKNTGVGADATHTPHSAPYLNCPTQAMRFPLVHPRIMIRDLISDEEVFRRRLLTEEGPLSRRLARRLSRFLTDVPAFPASSGRRRLPISSA